MACDPSTPKAASTTTTTTDVSLTSAGTIFQGSKSSVYACHQVHSVTGAPIAAKEKKLDRIMHDEDDVACAHGNGLLGDEDEVEYYLPLGHIRDTTARQTLSSHPHVVPVWCTHVDWKAKTVVTSMPKYTCDLGALIKHSRESNIRIYESCIQLWLRQVLSAIQYAHANGIIHRNLSPSKILVDDADGHLSIGGFGSSARVWFGAPATAMTPHVGDRVEYCAPEILSGSTSYTSAVDMWSSGVIFFEMVTMQPMFSGSAMDVATQIADERGTGPDVGVDFKKDPSKRDALFKLFCSNHPSLCVGDLLKGLLCVNPCRRLTAEAALRHPYFEPASTPFKSTRYLFP